MHIQCIVYVVWSIIFFAKILAWRVRSAFDPIIFPGLFAVFPKRIGGAGGAGAPQKISPARPLATQIRSSFFQQAAPSWKTRAILQNPPPARGSQPQRTALHSPRQNFRNLVIRVLNSAYESRTVRSQVYGR